MKKSLYLFIILFIALSAKSQGLISIDEVKRIINCKKDIECSKEILLKNKFQEHKVIEKNDSKTFQYSQSNLIGFQTFIEITYYEDTESPMVTLTTNKTALFETQYMKELKKASYILDEKSEITKYVKDDESKKWVFFIGDGGINNAKGKKIIVSYIPNITEKLNANEYAGNLIVKDLNNQNVKLNDLKGKSLYICFWSSTCKYCVQELPNLKKIYSEMTIKEKEKVEIVLINTDENLSNWKKGIQKFGLDFAKNFNTGLEISLNTATAFDVIATPQFAILDKNSFFLTSQAAWASEGGKKIIKYLVEKY